jgi:hypothetical protein
MPRALMIVVLFLAVAAAGTAVIFYQENRVLREELAALRARPPAASPAGTGSNVSLPATDPSTTPVAQTKPVGPSAPPASGNTAGPARERPRRDGEWRDRGQEFMAQALADPESRAAMLSRGKSQIDRMFGDYFVKLGLNETQIEALRTLLAERQMVRMESGMLERTAGNAQERADAQAFRGAKLAATEADINSILGPDGVKNLQAHLDSAPQRQVVDDIARRATYAGAPLSSEASDRLLATVQQVSADIPLPPLPGRGRWNGGGAEASSFTAETAATYMQDLRTRNQQIIDRSRAFLSQAQLEALADQQIDEMQQAEAQLNFMLRNPDARPPGGGRGPGG